MEGSLLCTAEMIKEARGQCTVKEALRTRSNLDRPRSTGAILPGRAGRAAPGKGQDFIIREK